MQDDFHWSDFFKISDLGNTNSQDATAFVFVTEKFAMAAIEHCTPYKSLLKINGKKFPNRSAALRYVNRGVWGDLYELRRRKPVDSLRLYVRGSFKWRDLRKEFTRCDNKDDTLILIDPSMHPITFAGWFAFVNWLRHKPPKYLQSSARLVVSPNIQQHTLRTHKFAVRPSSDHPIWLHSIPYENGYMESIEDSFRVKLLGGESSAVIISLVASCYNGANEIAKQVLTDLRAAHRMGQPTERMVARWGEAFWNHYQHYWMPKPQQEAQQP